MPQPSAQEERIQVERQRLAEVHRQRGAEFDSHVQAIQAARDELEAKVVALQQSCDQLQQLIRRTPMDDETVRYRVYHAMQTRMAGTVGHVLKRAQGTDRVLERAKSAHLEQERLQREEETRAKVRTAVQKVYDLQLPKEDDFESLYGEEEVANAS